MTKFLPRQPAPSLAFDLAGGGHWDLADQAPAAFTMIIFYRHRNCSVCNAYLKELDKMHDEFLAVGAEPAAVSTDTRENAEATLEDWRLKHLKLGYGLSFETAAEWGVYLSSGRHDTDPEIFTEPALFLIDAQSAIYFASIQSMPFGRVGLPDMLKWIPKLIEKQVPARGELSLDAVRERVGASA